MELKEKIYKILSKYYNTEYDAYWDTLAERIAADLGVSPEHSASAEAEPVSGLLSDDQLPESEPAHLLYCFSCGGETVETEMFGVFECVKCKSKYLSSFIEYSDGHMNQQLERFEPVQGS